MAGKNASTMGGAGAGVGGSEEVSSVAAQLRALLRISMLYNLHSSGLAAKAVSTGGAVGLKRVGDGCS